MKKIWLLLFIAIRTYATTPEEPIEQIKLGNFALPSSQQISPLFSFGQTILAKNTVVLQLFDYPFKGCNEQSNTLLPTLIYGLSNTTSLLISPSIITNSEKDGCRSRGIGDANLQLEQLLYNHDTFTSSSSITGVFVIGLPLGSASKNPPTGAGSPQFLLGLTASRLSIDWYVYAAPGIILSTENNCQKAGTQFLYQWGFGKNMGYIPGWIISLNLEFSGNYTQKSIVDDIPDEDSGGSLLLAGPSLWVSSERCTFQVGIIGAIYQKLNGMQNKSRYLMGFSVGYTFPAS